MGGPRRGVRRCGPVAEGAVAPPLPRHGWRQRQSAAVRWGNVKVDDVAFGHRRGLAELARAYRGMRHQQLRRRDSPPVSFAIGAEIPFRDFHHQVRHFAALILTELDNATYSGEGSLRKLNVSLHDST